ncbi:hypothetical protein ACJ8BR_25400, partial [Klebsiella pneumoniae]
CLTSIPFVVVCVFAFIVKRFRVFRAPLQGCEPILFRITTEPTPFVLVVSGTRQLKTVFQVVGLTS